MPQVLLSFGTLSLYRFGLSLFLAVFLASFLIWQQSRRQGLSEEKVFDTFLLTVFMSLIGGRVGYVVAFWPIFASDLSRIFLINHYPGLEFCWALGTGLIAAILAARSLDLDAGVLLDIFALAFSWAAVVVLVGIAGSVWLIVALLILALGLAWWHRRVSLTADLGSLARQGGILASFYLIFFLICFLMLMGSARREETIFYLVLLFISAVFLMIKFPADVLSQIKRHLETKAAEAQARLKTLKKEDPFTDKSRLLDRASEDTDAQTKAGHERVEAMQRQLGLILVQTRKALTEIRLGKYGICEACGKMIDTDRLAAMPAATLCLTCEKKREK